MESFQDDLEEELVKLIEKHYLCIPAEIIANYLVKSFIVFMTAIKEYEQWERGNHD